MPKKTVAKKLSKVALTRQLKKIRLLILDVDGVLTDGRLFWIEGQGWTRYFHVHDGYGIRLLQKAGIQIAVFSGSKSKDIPERMKLLGISHAYLGNENKTESLNDLVRVTQIRPNEMAFMGDDLFDIPVLKKVGLAISVPQALSEVKKTAHMITKTLGGSGAVREVADLILKVQGHEETVFSEKLSEESQRGKYTQNT